MRLCIFTKFIALISVALRTILNHSRRFYLCHLRVYGSSSLIYFLSYHNLTFLDGLVSLFDTFNNSTVVLIIHVGRGKFTLYVSLVYHLLIDGIFSPLLDQLCGIGDLFLSPLQSRYQRFCYTV